MNAFTEARMHLGVELRGAGRHPAALRESGIEPRALLDPARWTRLVRDAAARGLDLVVLPAGAPDDVSDAVALAEVIAPFVPGIGLVPQVDVAAAEPAVVSKAISALDVVSTGRAGWEPVTATAWRDAAAVVAGVTAPWTTPEPDDGVRRLPRRRPLTVVRGDEPDALAVAARYADVVRITAPGLDGAHAARERVRAAAAAAGRRPDDLTVLLDVEVHLADDAAGARASLRRMDAGAGELAPSTLRVVGGAVELANLVERTVALRAADGITFLPLALPTDLLAITGRVVPLLAGRGLFRTGSPGTGLRARFLARDGVPRSA